MIAVGEKIDFGSGGNSAPFKLKGWGGAEAWGSWTIASAASLIIPTPSSPHGLRLVLDTVAFLPRASDTKRLTVIVNGTQLGTVDYDQETSARTLSFDLPAQVLHDPFLSIEFAIDKPLSPKELGLSDDTRKLGIGVHWMKLEAGAILAVH
jgi:hypothetical protein